MKKPKSDLTAEIARAFLRYEPDTGKLFWRERDRKWFKSERSWKSWNTRLAGTEAFIANSGFGYKSGSILGRIYTAHRVAWLIQTGEWPSGEVDHQNHVKTDNRWQNLREVTRKGNQRNQSLHKRNTSGVCGVSWYSPTQKWRANIRVDGTQIFLGYFDDLEEAAAMRKAAEKKLGYHANHGIAY